MPPASLSTFAVIKPGPRTAKNRMKRVLQVRQVVIAYSFSLVWRTLQLTTTRLTHLRCCTNLREDRLYAFHNQTHLTIIMVPIPFGAKASRSSNSLTCGLVRQVEANLLDKLVKPGEKGRLFPFFETVHVSLRALRQQKSTASRNLEALV